MSEFDLIRRYFTHATPNALLGVGDDAALLRINNGMELVVSTDMLVSGTHFFSDADPFLLGHKTLAVNLSDIAAMGAQPRWATLAISLPDVNEDWLEKFSAGFFSIARQYGVELVGGDTTRGPLNLSVTIMGEVPQGAALKRSGAQVGDDVWVSGKLGDAALALAHLQGKVNLSPDDLALCVLSLHQPVPRVRLGQALLGTANSAIDISDGLLADVGHILQCSGVGADIQFDALPVSAAQHALPPSLMQHCVLSGGDDYELCFTAAATQRGVVENISQHLNLPLTRIGVIVLKSGCTVRTAQGNVINIKESGYDHFR